MSAGLKSSPNRPTSSAPRSRDSPRSSGLPRCRRISAHSASAHAKPDVGDPGSAPVRAVRFPSNRRRSNLLWSVRGYFAPKRAGVLQRPSLQWPMGIHQKDSCALWIEPRRASCCFGAVPHERVVEDLIQTPLEVLTLSDEQIAKQTHSATRGLPHASEATFGYPPRTALPEIGGKPTAGRHCEFQVPTVSGYRSAR